MLKGPDWGSEGTCSTPGSAVGSCDPGLEMRNDVSKVTGQAKPDSQRDPRVCIPPAVTLHLCPAGDAKGSLCDTTGVHAPNSSCLDYYRMGRCCPSPDTGSFLGKTSRSWLQ